MASALDNDDILTEILLRLPAKSLMRFKSVCKRWLSLISSDYFCHQHFLGRPLKPQPSLILRHRWYSDYFYWNPTLSINGEKVMIPYKCGILQACNGLLLLRSKYVYRVYNPTTRQSTEINIPYCDVAAVALAFDPSKSPYYKIVCCRYWFSKGGEIYLRVEVYDSERRSWKLSSEQFTPNCWFSGAQYWNNAIFWREYSDSDILYCFDIAKDEMKTLSTPQSHLGEVFDSYFQELDGNFCYLRLAFKPVSHELLAAVWELGGDGNSEWLLKHDVVFISQGKGECIGLIGGAENLVVLIYHYHSGKMRAYNFLHKRGEDIVELRAPDHDHVYDTNPHFKAFQFRETLALI